MVPRGCKGRMKTKQPAVRSTVTPWLLFHPTWVVSAHGVLWRLLWEGGPSPAPRGVCYCLPARCLFSLRGTKSLQLGYTSVWEQASDSSNHPQREISSSNPPPVARQKSSKACNCSQASSCSRQHAFSVKPRKRSLRLSRCRAVRKKPDLVLLLKCCSNRAAR